MFGMNSLKELDMMSVILISVSVILIIYIIRRSSNYSGSLMEGLANRSNGSNDTKYKFATAIKNWESSSIKYKSADMTDINKLASSIMNELDLSNNRSDYEEILADLENIGNSFSLILCVNMMKELNQMGAQNDTEGQATGELLADFMINAGFINQLQEFKRNLSDIHSWTSTTVPSMGSSKVGSIFSPKKSSDSDKNDKSSSSSSSGFSL